MFRPVSEIFGQLLKTFGHLNTHLKACFEAGTVYLSHKTTKKKFSASYFHLEKWFIPGSFTPGVADGAVQQGKTQAGLLLSRRFILHNRQDVGE